MRSIEGSRIGRNERLWRYCSADRFEWITRTNCLYFAAANQFADPFEGAVAVQTNLLPAADFTEAVRGLTMNDRGT